MNERQLASLAGYAQRELQWRIKELGNHGLVKCLRASRFAEDQLFRRRDVETILHLKAVEDEYGFATRLAIDFLDPRWRRGALRSPRLW